MISFIEYFESFSSRIFGNYRHAFQGEKVFLIGITSLVFPIRYEDIKWREIFGLDHTYVSKAVLLF